MRGIGRFIILGIVVIVLVYTISAAWRTYLQHYFHTDQQLLINSLSLDKELPTPQLPETVTTFSSSNVHELENSNSVTTSTTATATTTSIVLPYDNTDLAHIDYIDYETTTENLGEEDVYSYGYVDTSGDIKESKNNIVGTNYEPISKRSFDFYDQKDYDDVNIAPMYILDSENDEVSKFWYKNSFYHINDIHYEITQENTCRDADDIFVVVMVTSAPGRFHQRQQYRVTWGSIKKTMARNIKTLFIIGNSDNITIQKNIKEENAKYDDLVQTNFIDSYYNLTLKTLSIIKWVSDFCTSAKFLMKTDDDMLVLYNNLIRFLNGVYLDQNAAQTLYAGQIIKHHKPIRNRKHKWYVGHDDYIESYYPDYVSGTGYVLSVPLAKKLCTIAPTLALFPFEDVYMGMLVRKLNIQPRDNGMFLRYDVPYNYCKYKRKYISVHQLTDRKRQAIWNDMVKLGSICKL